MKALFVFAALTISSAAFAGSIQLTSGSTATISPGETTTVTCGGGAAGGGTAIYKCSSRTNGSLSGQGLSRAEAIIDFISSCRAQGFIESSCQSQSTQATCTITTQ